MQCFTYAFKRELKSNIWNSHFESQGGIRFKQAVREYIREMYATGEKLSMLENSACCFLAFLVCAAKLYRTMVILLDVRSTLNL